jgi:HK97 family phage major capsid protein
VDKKKIAELKAERDDALRAAKVICDKAIDEKREFTEDELAEVKDFSEKANDVGLKIDILLREKAVEETVEDLMGGGTTRTAAGNRLALAKSLGRMVVEDEAFKAWHKGIAPEGEVPERGRLATSPPIRLKQIPGLIGQKTLITGAGATSAGAFVETDYTGIYEPLGRWPLTLRQLVSVRQTTSDLVSFVRQTAQVTQAAAVQESNVTTYSGATGEISGEKPEGTSTWEEIQLAVQTIAVWIPATKRALADVPQLRGIIDQELRDDIAEELENQIVNGNGVGANLTGVLNTAGILTQAWNANILTTARQAITTLMVTGRTVPTAWVLNPSDWETIDLSVDANNQYYFGGPLRLGTRTLWGYPVVQCNHVPAGTGILGDWRKAVLWDRERVTISVSDSHEDFFIRNMIAILCEMRATFGLVSPDSFITVDLTAGS